ncbi:MAG: hypothetical protein V2A79_09700 [Planctomycetota bacterium]
MNAQQAPWDYIRQEVATADASGLLTTTNSNWDERETQGRGKAIGPGAKALLLAFIGDHAADPAALTARIKFSIYRSGGPAHVLGTYDIVIGGQAVVLKPRKITANATAKWADTITEVSQYWIAAPELVGVLANNVALIAVKTYGAAYITAEITALDAGLSLDVLLAPIDELP